MNVYKTKTQENYSLFVIILGAKSDDLIVMRKTEDTRTYVYIRIYIICIYILYYNTYIIICM